MTAGQQNDWLETSLYSRQLVKSTIQFAGFINCIVERGPIFVDYY